MTPPRQNGETPHDWRLIVPTWILAIATIELFIYTAKLWASTSGLVEDERKNSVRELRGYMLFSEANIRPPEDSNGKKVSNTNEPWHIEIAFQNFGKTPAFGVSVRYIVQALDTDETAEKELELSSKEIALPIPVAAPGHPYIIGVANALLRGSTTFRGIRMKKKSIYIWGRIDYFDTFGNPRWTRFQVCNHCKETFSFHLCRKGNGTDDKFSTASA